MDQNLSNLKQSTNKDSNFDIAILYDAAALQYATFGLWRKAVDYGYGAFTLYLKISNNDPSKILKAISPKTEVLSLDEIKTMSAFNIVFRLSFVATKVRHEKDKNYLYFINEFLKLSGEKKDIEVTKVLEQESITQKHNFFSF